MSEQENMEQPTAETATHESMEQSIGKTTTHEKNDTQILNSICLNCVRLITNKGFWLKALPTLKAL